MNTSCHDRTQQRYRENPKYKGHFLRLCSAHAKRTGQLCTQLAMSNGKCRLHGGLSSGPGNVLFPSEGDRSGKRKLRNKLAVLARRARAKEVQQLEQEQLDHPLEQDPGLRRELNAAADIVDYNQLATACAAYREGTMAFWQFMEVRKAVASRSAERSPTFPG
jgi:hypothetical protein